MLYYLGYQIFITTESWYQGHFKVTYVYADIHTSLSVSDNYITCKEDPMFRTAWEKPYNTL